MIKEHNSQLDNLDSDKRLLWEYFQHLHDGLISYSQTQTQYRQLGSSWLIFGLGAIGYLLKDLNDNPKIESIFLFIGLVGLILGLGMYIIYMFDVLIQQKLLDSVYIEKRAIESANSWLPQTSNNARFLLEGKGIRFIVQFYVFSIGLSLTASGTGFILFFLYKANYQNNLLIACIATLATLAIIGLILFKLSKNTLVTPAFEQKFDFFNKRKEHYDAFQI